MRVTVLLCDAADEADGKLYILGGGWSLVRTTTPFNMALAILVSVEWHQANQRFALEAALVDEDGERIKIGEREAVASGSFEVGRPAGLKPGTDLNVSVTLDFSNVSLSPGGYRWEVSIDGTQMAIAPFRVLGDR